MKKFKRVLPVALFAILCLVAIIILVLAAAPAHLESPFLVGSDASNGTSFNLGVTWNVTDSDNEPFKNLTDWRLEGESYAVLNLPFDKNEQFGTNLKWMDYTLNSNNATERGTVVWNATGGHDGWGAYDFIDADPAYLQIEPTSSLNGAQEAITISCWFKPYNVTIADNSTGQIVTRKNVTDGYTLQFSRDIGKNVNGIFYRPNVGESPGTSVKYDISNFNVGEWYHLAARHDGSSADIFVDGTEVASESAGFDVPVVDDHNFTIGGADYEPNNLNASIDDCQVYYASLSDEQIALLSEPEWETLSSEETAIGDNWTVAVIPFDNTSAGSASVSNNVEIKLDPFRPNLDLTQTSQTRGKWQLYEEQRLMHLNSQDAGAINFRQGFLNGQVQYGAEGAYTNTMVVQGKDFKVTHEIAVNSSLASFLNSTTQYLMRIEANETITVINESVATANDTALYFLKATLRDSRASIVLDYSAEAASYNISFSRVNDRTIDVYLTQNFSQYSDGATITIDPLIGPNEAPTHSLPSLIGAWASQVFSAADDIEVSVENFTTADTDGDSVENIYSWWLNEKPMMLLHMPFAGNDDYASETHDYSGRGQDSSSFNGNPIYNETGGANGQGAYEFDGKNDAIILQNPGNADFFNTNYTISVWAKANGIGESAVNFPSIIGKRASQTNREWALLHTKSTNKLNFQFFNDSGFALNPFTGTITSLGDGAWAHIVITRQDDNFTMYVNNSLIKSNVIDTTNENSQGTAPLVIGNAGSDLSNSYWNGSIDDIMIFNRTLTVQEIDDLYNRNYNTLRADATLPNDLLEVTVTPNDGREDGTAKNVTRYMNLNPTHSRPIIAKSGNWTLAPQDASDTEGDPITYHYGWMREDGRGLLLNIQFNRIGAAGFVSDYSSNGNNLTKYDGRDIQPFASFSNTWPQTPTFSSTAGYDGGHAYNFNLNNQWPKQSFIVGKAINAPIISAGSNYTLLSRFKSQDVSPTNSQGLVGYSDSNTGNKFGYHSYIWNSKMRCLISNGTDGRAFTSATALQDNRWYHGGCVFNGTSVALYLDGQIDTQGPVTLTGTFPTNSSGSPFQGDVIGSLYHPNIFTLNGTIDDVQMWDLALTEQQIDLIWRNRTDVLHESMITEGVDWTGYVTLNDGFGDSITRATSDDPTSGAASAATPGRTPSSELEEQFVNLSNYDLKRLFAYHMFFTEQPTQETTLIDTDKTVTSCSAINNTAGIRCAIAANGGYMIKLNHISDGERFIDRYNDRYTVEFSDGSLKAQEVKYTVFNLNKKFELKNDGSLGVNAGLTAPYIFTTNSEGEISGVRAWVLAVLILFFIWRRKNKKGGEGRGEI